MSTDVCVLGPVVFDEWSTPEQITQGGKHTLAVHKLIGGRRVTHAMGPDYADISLSGKLWGANAEGVAVTLNALKDAGEPLPLIVMGNAYTVVISDFTWGFIRYPQYAEFHVSCVVVDGYGLSSIVADAASLANLVAADLATATALF
jgi:hypothetical protein